MTEHLVVWHIGKGKPESDKQVEGDSNWSAETLSERVLQDLKYFNCTRIHAVNGYGCAFLKGKLPEIILTLLKYPPCLKFRVRPSSHIDQVGLMIERMKEEQVRIQPNADAIQEYSLDSSPYLI